MTVTPSGGPQTAEGSNGTLQIGGGPRDATGTTGTFFSAGGASLAASPASTNAAPEDALPTAAQPLGAERKGVPLGGSTPPLAAAARPSALPFPGLELGFVVLLALALFASGYVLRRSGYTAA